MREALIAPDGVTVTVSGAMVNRVVADSDYSFIRDPWSPQRELLPVYARAELRNGWSVSVTGVTRSIGGVRVVVATSIRLCTDKWGHPVPPLAPGVESPFVKDIPIETTTDDPPIPPSPNEPSGPGPEPLTAEPGTIAWALRQPVGTYVTITNVTCTADSLRPTGVADQPYDFGGFFYVQQSRTAGIRVNWYSTTYPRDQIHRGDNLTIGGEVALVNGEKLLYGRSVTRNGPSSAIAPVAMNNRSIGGRDLAPDTPGVVGGYGLYNKGMLVRSFGTVTYVDPAGAYCYIDDGSALSDGSSHVGVKVMLARQGPGWLHDELPQVGQFLSVTGMSSSELRGGQPVRLVRQVINFGRQVAEDCVDPDPMHYDWAGRGLMTAEGGEAYVTFYRYGYLTPYLYRYPPFVQAGSTGRLLGCLDVDNDGQTFWGGTYDSATDCKLLQFSFAPPYQLLTTLDLSWLPPRPGNPEGGRLDGLAIAPDGTFWISSDLGYRVYHVARDGSMLQEFTTTYAVSGHEFIDGYLWLVSMTGPTSPAEIKKATQAVSQVAWFKAPYPVEDLDWRQNDPLHLRGFDVYRFLHTWDMSGIQVVPRD